MIIEKKGVMKMPSLKSIVKVGIVNVKEPSLKIFIMVGIVKIKDLHYDVLWCLTN